MPTVSIVMPAFNAERFIGAAIDSILAQTYRDFELLILDDGSKDKTAAIVQDYSDPRINLIQKQNEGVALTLNRGVELAQGEYIWRHDADDISMNEKLEEEMKFMEAHEDCLLVSTQVAFMTERGKVAWNRKQPKDNWLGTSTHRWVTFEDFSPFSPITHGTALIRKRAFESTGVYRAAFITSEDIDMWLRMMEHGKLAVLNQCLSLHRVSSGSATAVHGWKNAFYREAAKKFWSQRQAGQPDDLEINGFISEPEAPDPPLNSPKAKGRNFRHDLLTFHYSIHLDAQDWLEIIRIIRLSLVSGWRLIAVYRAIITPLLPDTLVRMVVRIKSMIRTKSFIA